MAERLSNTREQKGFTRSNIRVWALLCLTLGTAGFAILQNGLLNVHGTDGNALLKAMQDSSDVMGMATVAIVLQAIHSCAAPLFAFLLVEGFTHTKSFGKYLLRVLGVAVLSELPFNLAVGGQWLALDSRNPAFALVLALLMLFLFKHFSERGFVSGVVYVAVTAAGVVWSLMLGIFDGAPLVLLTVVLYALRGKPTLRMILGCVTAFACSIFSLYYMLAPITMILLHFYNGEKGESNPWVDHLSYPAILLVLGIVGNYLI